MFAKSLISPALYLWLIHWDSWLFFIWQHLANCVVVSRAGGRYSGVEYISTVIVASPTSATKSI